ncbi:hypothetical protein LF41_558 [Lysobacter dokdonensis DS-58]|uniref:Uncharacterized protein n=1 Tax=Lysobacter dokdonensis DS-58 TaxID=1300345 RepID=A0A0A2WFK7_9GAMM|nr:hypothetical protein LF41_558 [Lysobacter dokdonensis DS-58]
MGAQGGEGSEQSVGVHGTNLGKILTVGTLENKNAAGPRGACFLGISEACASLPPPTPRYNPRRPVHWAAVFARPDGPPP